MSSHSPAAVSVIKIGGSVLTGRGSYERAASLLKGLVADPSARLVAVVSAAFGRTDALLDEARAIAAGSAPDEDALALLWSTGETRSVALLTLALRAAGVSATGLGAHEIGLSAGAPGPTGNVAYRLNRLPILAVLSSAQVAVVPGFLATRGGRIVTLGRGGSDLSAVRIATALQAGRCVLLKDVDGYFTADPRLDPDARPIPTLSHDQAIGLADAGCPVVQRQALCAARDAGLEIVVRGFSGPGTTVGLGLDPDDVPCETRLVAAHGQTDRRDAPAQPRT